MGLVLDTSILVSAERRRFDLPAFLDAEHAADSLFVSAITASELLHGVFRADRRRRRTREAFVDDVLTAVAVLPFDVGCARIHSKLWAALEAAGERIGPHDLIIAATCLTLQHTLATLNEKEFRKVPRLSLARAQAYVTRRA